MKYTFLKSLFVLFAIIADDVVGEEHITFQDGLEAYQKGKYLESLYIWQTLADEGDPNSAHSAGVLYAYGLGIEQDYEKAFALYLESAKAGYAPAEYDVGRCYFNGEGVDVDHSEAARWWRKAAEKENIRALFNLATLYKKGLGVSKDEALAYKYYRRAADLGDSYASKILADQQSQANTDSSEASDLVSNGIKRELWIMRQSGDHYTVQASAFSSESSALAFVKKYDLDNDVAIFRANVGGKIWYKAIYRSFEKRKDALQARDKLKQRIPDQSPWLRKFADIQEEINAGKTSAKIGSSQLEIVQQLQQGQSAFNNQNYAEALKAWEPLAKSGVVDAQYGLGFMYESGWGVQRDYTTAFQWYEKAATLGHAKSQYNLGLMYLNGLGIDKDLSKGRYWVEVAASQKDRRALDLIESGLVKERQ